MVNFNVMSKREKWLPPSPEAIISGVTADPETPASIAPGEVPEAAISTMSDSSIRNLSEMAAEAFREQLAWYDDDRLLPFRVLRRARLEQSGFYWSSLLETVLLLAAILLIGWLFHPEDVGYVSLAFHPFWLVILLVAGRYYFKESAISGAVTAAVYLGFQHLQSTPWELEMLASPLLFLAVSFYLGSRTQYMVERMDFLRAELRDLHEQVRSAKAMRE